MKIKSYEYKATKIADLAPGDSFRFVSDTQGVCIKLEDRAAEYSRWAALETGHVGEASRNCEVRKVNCEVIEHG